MSLSNHGLGSGASGFCLVYIVAYTIVIILTARGDLSNHDWELNIFKCIVCPDYQHTHASLPRRGYFLTAQDFLSWAIVNYRTLVYPERVMYFPHNRELRFACYIRRIEIEKRD